MASSSTNPHKVKWTPEMDMELLAQVLLYNPFKQEHTWPGFEHYLNANVLLKNVSEKGIRDHTHTLLERRHKVVKLEEKASGIAVPPLTPLDTAADECLALKSEAERVKGKMKRKVDGHAEQIRSAAMATLHAGTQEASQENLVPSTSSTSPPVTKRRAGPANIAQVLQARLELKQQAREEEKKEKEEEKKREEEKQQREYKLREKELELRERELKLKEKQAEAAAEQQNLLLKFLLEQVKERNK